MKKTYLATVLSVCLASAGLGLANTAFADQASAPFSLPSVATNQPAGPAFFFEKAVPSQVTTSSGSKLSLNDVYYKDGKSSLQWDFAPNGTLTFNVPYTVGNDLIKPRNFAAWIYAPESFPADAKLHFAFYKDGKVQKQFDMPLTFTGWEGFALPYRDMPGVAVNDNTAYDKLVITAPNLKGKLLLDQVLMSPHVDNRHSVPNYLFPWVNPSSQTAANAHWNALLTYNNYLLKKFPKPFNYNAKFDEGGLTAIYQRMDYFNGVNENAPVDPAKVKAVLDKFASFKLDVHADGSVSGPVLEYSSSRDIVKDAANFSPEFKNELIKGNDLRNVGKNMMAAALLLRSNNLNNTDRAALETQFLITFKYILNQGFRFGDTYQLLHHLGYQDRELFNALFTERQLLASNNLIEPAQRMMQWYTGAGRIWIPEVIENNLDTDNTQLTWMLDSYLLLPDYNQRVEQLTQFSKWISETVKWDKGVSGGIKPDYTVFHHHQHYVAYGTDALNGISATVYSLSHTPYALDLKAQQRIDGALNAMAFYTKGSYIPVALAARHPDTFYKVRPQPYKWLALSGSLDGTHEVDPTLAGTYARLVDLPSYAGYAALPEPTGMHVYPYSSSLVARGASAADQKDGKSWLLIARGYSRYLPGNESYQANNLYGRYNLYGKLEFIPANLAERAYHHDGFDWRYVSGTTAPTIPVADLKAKLLQLPAAGLEEDLLSDQSYSGAVQLNKAGFFAQIVHGHAKYNQEGFWAHKSYFVVGNHVIALGSNIDSDDKVNPVATTLVQQYMYDPSKPVTVNGTPVTLGQSFVFNNPQAPSNNNAANLTIALPNGVTYFVPNNQKVDVRRAVQTNPNDTGKGESSGDFTVAYIDQGVAPQDGTYQYSMVLESAPNQAAPAYSVITNSPDLQVVRDTDSGYQAYAFYKAGKVALPDTTEKKLADGTVLLSASQPSMAITQLQDNGQLFLAVTNPDLNLYQGTEADQVKDGKQVEVSTYSRTWADNASKATVTTYTVRGLYKLEYLEPNVKVTYDNGNTVLTVTQNNAATTRIILNPVK